MYPAHLRCVSPFRYRNVSFNKQLSRYRGGPTGAVRRCSFLTASTSKPYQVCSHQVTPASFLPAVPLGLSSINRRTMSFHQEKLFPFVAPEWASDLPNKPKWKLKLAMCPTPIHRWNLPGVPDDVEVYIKRDDMTGGALSGNKIRKLEFLLSDALDKGCKHVVTLGGLQSNHCRATAVAARQLGMTPHLILRTDAQTSEDIGSLGNVFLDRLAGAAIYLVPLKSPQKTHLWPRMAALVDRIRADTGEKAYPIIVGGSDGVGLYGYINAFQELLDQGARDHFDDIVFACGSGGTAEGLSIGNHLSDAGLKIHGISVSDHAQAFYDMMNEKIADLGLKHVRAEDIYDAIDGHKGLGYGISTQDEMDFSLDVAAQTGIMLDPVYTAKAVKGMVHELNSNRHRFKGNRILFLHTGGIFGMYDGRMTETLLDRSRDSVNFWPDVQTNPW